MKTNSPQTPSPSPRHIPIDTKSNRRLTSSECRGFTTKDMRYKHPLVMPTGEGSTASYSEASEPKPDRETPHDEMMEYGGK